jgi:hypothetical protein
MRRKISLSHSVIIAVSLSLFLLPIFVAPVSASSRWIAAAWWNNSENLNYHTDGIQAYMKLHAGYVGLDLFDPHFIAGLISIRFPDGPHGYNLIEIGWYKERYLFSQPIKLFIAWIYDGDYDDDRLENLEQDSTHRYKIAGTYSRWWVELDDYIRKNFYWSFTGGFIKGAGEHWGDGEGEYESHFTNVKYYLLAQPWRLWDSIDTLNCWPYLVQTIHNYEFKIYSV